MKKHLYSKLICILLAGLSTLALFGQSPEGIIYQAEARDSRGIILRNQTIDIKITILAGNPNGAIVWEGFHNVTTDTYGLFTLTIGEGTGGSYYFSNIDWANQAHFLNVQVYYLNSWSNNGTTQFLSVPYALHAKTSATATEVSYFNIPDAPNSLSQFINDMNFLAIESDPVFAMYPAAGISQTDISNWTTAFGWGDHSLAGYLTSITETDPIFGLAPASTITADQLTQWNTAFGWGDHSLPGYLTDESDPVFAVHPASQLTIENIDNWDLAFGWGDHTLAGYLTSETELDPIFGASPASTISADNLAQWISAYGWGDHAEAGYLTEETDPDPTNEIQNLSQVLTEGNDAGTRRISNLGDPIDAQDAVTKAYIDQLETRIGILEDIIAGLNLNVDSDDDGYTQLEGDCDDTDPDIHPGAEEICDDEIDNNCDGIIDENCGIVTLTCFPVQDNPINTMIFLLNQERRSNGLDPVAPDPRLMAAAQGHSDYMAGEGELTHVGEGGSTYLDRVGDEGYLVPSGELVAFGVGDQGSAESILSAWMGSQGHADIILQQGTWGSYNHMHVGIGMTENYWTVEFGASDEPPYCDDDPDVDGDQDGYSVIEGDCDDTDPDIHPGALEYCDGIDNDCDGSTDEDCVVLDCHGAVVDMFECVGLNCLGQFDLSCINSQCSPDMEMSLTCLDLSCVVGFAEDSESFLFDETLSNEVKADLLLENCGLIDEDGDGYSNFTGDCDDTDETVYPGADEICDDGIDQDCNGVDAICGDDDGDGFLPPEDCDNTNPEIYPGAEEYCNDLDDNCDDLVDNVTEEENTWYEDGDQDGAGNPEVFEVTCNPLQGWVQNDWDCDDTNAAIYQGAPEIVGDGVDQNCDLCDDCYQDMDGDGYGAGTVVTGLDLDCNNFFQTSTLTGDCNDAVPGIYPGAEEVVGDGVDQDCDGFDVCYEDLDGDGFGSDVIITNFLGSPYCGSPNASSLTGDCDDNDASVFPGADEICDDIDQDCDGILDEGPCDLSNANVACVSGNCQITACFSGYADCDEDPENGCETDLDENPICSNYTNLGSLSGDLPSSTSIQAYGEKWYRIYIAEDNDACENLGVRISLHPGSGTDYDLYVYEESNGVCASEIINSRNGGSGSEEVNLTWEDNCLLGIPLGTDEGKYLFIKVAYYQANSCLPYTLEISSHALSP